MGGIIFIDTWKCHSEGRKKKWWKWNSRAIDILWRSLQEFIFLLLFLRLFFMFNCFFALFHLLWIIFLAICMCLCGMRDRRQLKSHLCSNGVVNGTLRLQWNSRNQLHFKDFKLISFNLSFKIYAFAIKKLKIRVRKLKITFLVLTISFVKNFPNKQTIIFKRTWFFRTFYSSNLIFISLSFPFFFLYSPSLLDTSNRHGPYYRLNEAQK
jgi:hypothetical protein